MAKEETENLPLYPDSAARNFQIQTSAGANFLESLFRSLNRDLGVLKAYRPDAKETIARLESGIDHLGECNAAMDKEFFSSPFV